MSLMQNWCPTLVHHLCQCYCVSNSMLHTSEDGSRMVVDRNWHLWEVWDSLLRFGCCLDYSHLWLLIKWECMLLFWPKQFLFMLKLVGLQSTGVTGANSADQRPHQLSQWTSVLMNAQQFPSGSVQLLTQQINWSKWKTWSANIACGMCQL